MRSSLAKALGCGALDFAFLFHTLFCYVNVVLYYGNGHATCFRLILRFGGQRVSGCGEFGLHHEDLPEGSVVVPFWDYLIGF